MFADGQRVERHEVEPCIAAAYPSLSHFIAKVTETEKPERGHVHVIVEICGPNGERLFHPIEQSHGAVYYSTRPMVGMPQVSGDWAA